MFVSAQPWIESTPVPSLDVPVRRENPRAENKDLSLNLHSFAPLVPDMKFGQTWGALVSSYAAQFGVLPRMFRVLRISTTHAAIVEMHVDAMGYGRVGIVGTETLSSLDETLQGLRGRFAHVILDDEIGGYVTFDARCVSDTALHGRAYEVLGRSFGVDIQTWRAALREDVRTGRPLPTRVALERMRGEMAVWVALLQRAKEEATF